MMDEYNVALLVMVYGVVCVVFGYYLRKWEGK